MKQTTVGIEGIKNSINKDIEEAQKYLTQLAFRNATREIECAFNSLWDVAGYLTEVKLDIGMSVVGHKLAESEALEEESENELEEEWDNADDY